jgi:hypothetical protein
LGRWDRSSVFFGFLLWVGVRFDVVIAIRTKRNRYSWMTSLPSSFGYSSDSRILQHSTKRIIGCAYTYIPAHGTQALPPGISGRRYGSFEIVLLGLWFLFLLCRKDIWACVERYQ